MHVATRFQASVLSEQKEHQKNRSRKQAVVGPIVEVGGGLFYALRFRE